MIDWITSTYNEYSGYDALRNNLEVLDKLGDMAASSFGPAGMGKLLVREDGIYIRTSGWGWLEKVDVSSPVGSLVLSAVRSIKENFIGGTTTYLTLVGRLAREVMALLDIGLRPVEIIKGLEHSETAALTALSALAHTVSYSEHDRIILPAVKPMLSYYDSALWSKTVWDTFMFLKEGAVSRNKRFLSYLPEALDVSCLSGLDTDIDIIDGAVLKLDIEPPDGRYVLFKDNIDTDIMGQKVEMTIGPEYNISGLYTIAADAMLRAGVTGAFIPEKVKNRAVLEAEIGGRGMNAYTVDEDQRKKLSRVIREHWNGRGEPVFTDLSFKRLNNLYSIVRGPDDFRTVVIRNKNNYMKDEAVDSFMQGIYALLWSETGRDFKVVYGSGISYIILSRHLQEVSLRTEGRSGLVLSSVSRAFENTFKAILGNAGVDTIEQITRLHTCKDVKDMWSVLNSLNIPGFIENTLDPYSTQEYIIKTAMNSMISVVRIDDVLQSRYSAKKPEGWGLPEEVEDMDDEDFIEKYANERFGRI